MGKPLWKIVQGDAAERLTQIPDGAVQCVITSPPFYGLRDYGTGTWVDGDPSCDHLAPMPGGTERSGLGKYDNRLSDAAIEQKVTKRQRQYKQTCRHCGARRVDLQIGLEESPEEYVEKLVAVFHEVKRVLADDGIIWVNLGDSYASHGGQRGAGKGPALNGVAQEMRGQPQGHRLTPRGYKRKDLLGIPWMVAFALRADGWFLRSDVIWEKPNARPESVKDRPSCSHEYLFMLSKSKRYFYDDEAIREPDKGTDHPRKVLNKPEPSGGVNPPNRGIRKAEGRNGDGRNKRSVWTIMTVPSKVKHYAAFPPKLIEPCVLAGAPRGAVVLDPFAGTGVTVMVAARHGRRGIGIELSAEHVATARERISVGLTRPIGSAA